jgi:hypothetical protein
LLARDPDYSAVYVELFTNGVDAHGHALRGDGITFTLGRGNEVCAVAAHSLLTLPSTQATCAVLCCDCFHTR